MGKNSLLKSTSEKTDEELKTKTKKKKPAAKAKPKAKAVPKVKKTAKAKATVKAKAKAKVKAKAKAPAKKTPAKKPVPPKKKKVSVKDLVQKKFDTWKPEKIFTVSQDEEDLKNFSAPPFASGTKEETQRIKALLLKKFDLAEIKAAAEKAADEKAVAAKAAEEKFAVEDAAVEPEVSVSYDPPDSGEPIVSDPMDNVMKYMVVAFVILVALVIGTSMLNHDKYYLRDTDGALEIWQGRFSPMGEKLLITLPGVQAPEIMKDTYSKTEACPFIFDYYVGKADTLLEVSGMPDFDGMRSYLNKAMTFAVTDESKKILNGRLHNMELVILLYKAEVATSKASIEDLEKAKGYLGEAARLDLDDLQSDLVDQKIESIDESIKSIEAKEAEAAVPTPLPAESTTTY
ncbi:MAG: hypothetical protein JSV38_09885 [Desulfobacterales bacterium]|nr:MAG: hypothetical protein JSV38_09885 [Desulfobacterales bacterium]